MLDSFYSQSIMLSRSRGGVYAHSGFSQNQLIARAFQNLPARWLGRNPPETRSGERIGCRRRNQKWALPEIVDNQRFMTTKAALARLKS